MMRSYIVRLYPSDYQKQQINQWFGCHRWVYNHFLEKAIKDYEKGEKFKSRFDMMKELTKIRSQKETFWLQLPSRAMLNSALINLSDAYSRLFKGQNSKPRFKRRGIEYGVSLDKTRFSFINNLIDIEKLGYIKFRGNQRWPDNKVVKGTLKRDSNDQYYFVVTCDEVTEEYIKPKYKKCGIDLGLVNPVTIFYKHEGKEKSATFSGSNLKKRLKRLQKLRARQQQRLARCKKGSNNRRKMVLKIAKLHWREKNQRLNWAHQTSRKIVNRFKTINLETNCIKEMTKKDGSRKQAFNRQMLELGLGKLVSFINYKSENQGRNFNEIEPYYNSQKCASCGSISKRNRMTQSKFKCISCGNADNADRNAAKNCYYHKMVA